MPQVRHISDSELQGVIERAHEIGGEYESLLEGHAARSYVSAAEEAGVPREAILEALRERLYSDEATYDEGMLVFASNGEGWFVAAKVLEDRGSTVYIKVLAGTKTEVAKEDIRPLNMMPGGRIHFSYYGSWQAGEITAYDNDARVVSVNYWGTKENKPLTDVRIKDMRGKRQMSEMARAWAYSAAAFLAGSGIGAFITWLATRGG